MDRATSVLRQGASRLRALLFRPSISRQTLQRVAIIFIFFIFFSTLFHFRDTPSPISISIPRKTQLPRDAAANATLGVSQNTVPHVICCDSDKHSLKRSLQSLLHQVGAHVDSSLLQAIQVFLSRSPNNHTTPMPSSTHLES